ncbi:MAG: type II/IV secretion system protein [Gemmatimonadaceae bacterium]|nr:type II/IV secretion system protein [Gemmatimonadaceae bacterium]
MSDHLRAAASGPLAAELPARFMEEHALLPLRVEPDGALVVACGRPPDATIADELQRRFGRTVRWYEAPLNDVQAAILAARREATPVAPASALETEAMGDLRAQANDAPVVQLVNAMLADALRTGASDLHLETGRDGLRARLRQDGVLRDVATYPARLAAGALSRVKLLAGLDIAERRLPQDGRARVRLGDREVDLRVSTLPALHGESVVLRVLDHGGGARDLPALGMPVTVEAAFARVLARTSGLVLVTGPTGSGKTTTLYAALARLNQPGVKVVTVEDPVEYQLPGVTQVPVHRKAGLTFATALRSILRHDPDIVMVGEMRDRETADVAIQAALTGHLVFSTLHTGDAPSGVTRLVDMGVEPYLVAATVQAILAQRLVRVLCPACVRRAPTGEGVPVGCAACGGSGFRGRTGLYELFVPDDAARQRIVAGATGDQLRAAARTAGVASLVDAGRALVADGITTMEEILRVTNAGEAE